MKFLLQVTVLDPKDYILEFKDFKDNEIGPMLKYINKHTTNEKVRKIEIKRWRVDD